MRWRDIKTEPMTKADGDDRGFVLQKLLNGHIDAYPWDNKGNVAAWMPLSDLPEFVPQIALPVVPEGWRMVVQGDAFDERRKRWNHHSKEWVAGQIGHYAVGDIYIIPIDPPKPTYRAFANAAEFEPFKNMWWRGKSYISSHQNPPAQFNDHLHGNNTWEYSLAEKVFCNGTPEGLPFGVKQ